MVNYYSVYLMMKAFKDNDTARRASILFTFAVFVILTGFNYWPEAKRPAPELVLTGLLYDISVSDLAPASKANGIIKELSIYITGICQLVHIIMIKQDSDRLILGCSPVYCPLECSGFYLLDKFALVIPQDLAIAFHRVNVAINMH